MTLLSIDFKGLLLFNDVAKKIAIFHFSFVNIRCKDEKDSACFAYVPFR